MRRHKYHESQAPGLLFSLTIDILADVVRILVADHQLSAQYFLQLLADNKVISAGSWRSPVAILTIRLSISISLGHNFIMIFWLMSNIHAIPASVPVNMLIAPPICLPVHNNGRSALGDPPLLNDSAGYLLSINAWSRRSGTAAALTAVPGSCVSGRIVVQFLL